MGPQSIRWQQNTGIAAPPCLLLKPATLKWDVSPNLHVIFQREASAGAQIVVLDKLDYCASVHNLDAVKDCPNFQV